MDELVNWHEYMRVFAGLYAMVPAPQIIPLFLGLTVGRSRSEQTRAALVSSLTFVIVLVVFIYFGGALLALFGVSLAAFRLAGGFLLLLMAVDMLRASPPDDRPVGKEETAARASITGLAIVPLGIPILAGPGAMSAVVLFATDHDAPGHQVLVSLVVLAVAVTVLVTLLVAGALTRFFTPAVASVFNKLMGLIIAAIAFEFIMDGIAGHFPILETIHTSWIVPVLGQLLTSFS